jgi:hypothetical protein
VLNLEHVEPFAFALAVVPPHNPVLFPGALGHAASDLAGMLGLANSDAITDPERKADD